MIVVGGISISHDHETKRCSWTVSYMLESEDLFPLEVELWVRLVERRF